MLLGSGRGAGRWIGGGCGGIGISGQVDRESFMRAMDGCDPRSGERLRPVHGRTKVAAFDLTFSALAGIYQTAGYRVIGVAPTGRAARELADAADIPAFTVHRLVADVEDAGDLAARTVVLFDEAGTAPTRPSAALFEIAERARAKVIAVGDSGQLPSVAAGGWFRAVTELARGPELRRRPPRACSRAHRKRSTRRHVRWPA